MMLPGIGERARWGPVSCVVVVVVGYLPPGQGCGVGSGINSTLGLISSSTLHSHLQGAS